LLCIKESALTTMLQWRPSPIQAQGSGSMEWLERYVLGHPPMDDTHCEFVGLVNALAAAGNDEVATALDNLITHSIAHFDQENHWMEESGFPPLHCHVGEHMRVLASLESVRRLVRNGNPGVGRVLAKEMVAWFDNHAATMDAALAAHMRYAGYVPAPLAVA
jgi:hemerythrin